MEIYLAHLRRPTHRHNLPQTRTFRTRNPTCLVATTMAPHPCLLLLIRTPRQVMAATPRQVRLMNLLPPIAFFVSLAHPLLTFVLFAPFLLMFSLFIYSVLYFSTHSGPEERLPPLRLSFANATILPSLCRLTYASLTSAHPEKRFAIAIPCESKVLVPI